MANPLSDKAAIVGVGYAPERFSRHSGQSIVQYTIESCLRAVEEAGLQVQDIDGLVSMQWADAVSPSDLASFLGLKNVGYYSPSGTIAPGLVAGAAEAVASGLCEVALVYRSMSAAFGVTPSSKEQRIGGKGQWYYPYGLHNDIYYNAFWMTRYMQTYGVGEDKMGTIAVANREHAHRNPHAVFTGAPLTIEDYLSSRYIAAPMHLFDADMPVDAGVALVVTTAERARNLRHPPVYVHNWASALAGNSDLENWPDYTFAASKYCAERLWDRSGLKAQDMDFAQLYDGFSVLFLNWLEDMGFCERGEGADFVADGHTRLAGKVPMNTAGGALSEGRTHAWGHLAESVYQLRGQAGPRQIEGAELGVITGAGMNTGTSALVLRR